MTTTAGALLAQLGLHQAATIEQFDFHFRPERKRQVVLRYLDPTFVEQARCLTLIGAPGLGKTMLALAIATKLVQVGYGARFITAQSLANHLGRATTSSGRQRVLRPLLRCDVLVLNELGYLQIGAYRNALVRRANSDARSEMSREPAASAFYRRLRT